MDKELQEAQRWNKCFESIVIEKYVVFLIFSGKTSLHPLSSLRHEEGGVANICWCSSKGETRRTQDDGREVSYDYYSKEQNGY